MKTSNIILFSIMSSFSLIIIAGALELRIFGKLHNDKTSMSPDMVNEVDADLEPFQILVINQSINVAIEEGDSLTFKVYRDKDDSSPVVKFHQSVDTLFIDQVAFGEKGRSLHAVVKLKDSKALKAIYATNSTFSIQDFSGSSLAINLKDSRFYVTAELKYLQDLTLSTVKSYVSYNGDITGKLETNLDESEVYIQGDVSAVSGTIRNNSDLQLHNVSQISFSKDSTSSIRIMN